VGIGLAYRHEVEIREGLAGDELVVIGGQHRVREGSTVEARVETGSLVESGGLYRLPREEPQAALSAVPAGGGPSVGGDGRSR
jgi:hypothetical protein